MRLPALTAPAVAARAAPLRARYAAAIVAVLAATLGGCMALHEAAPKSWYAAHNGVAPKRSRAFVCHGFGCYYKTKVAFAGRDLERMRQIMGSPKSAAAERKAIARLVSWAEKRVAGPVGSAGDVGGLDLWNARERGQMDCIDEASNTTSYLLIAREAGLIRHHTIGRPVARGFFLDGRYPHATAVIVAGATPYAVDSWPRKNGAAPEIMLLETWFERSRAR